ncbi:MAG: hypothetical protein IJX27_00395, partial [Clostridia bacterium]|nr:hypothetical protein [Clostridia bacterium]
MKRLTAMFSLLLCVVLLCTSCGASSMTFEELYSENKYEDKYPTLGSISEIPTLEGFMHVPGEYENETQILAFRNKDASKLKFYNAETDSWILTFDNDYIENFRTFSVYGNSMLIVVEEDENKEYKFYTKIYDANGNLVATKLGSTELEYWYNAVTVSADLFQFDGKIYRVSEKGAVSTVVSNPFFGDIPSFEIKTESHYYDFNSTMGGSASIYVYDNDLENVFFWEVPYSTAVTTSMVLLEENKVLVQFMEMLPDTETKYDFVMSGTKCNLTSLVIDTETGKEKKVKLDYIVSESDFANNIINNDGVDNFFPEDVKNITFISPIEDRKVVTSSTSMKIVCLKGSDASIALEISPEIPLFECEQIANDRFIYKAHSGDSYLINSKGKVISVLDSDVFKAAYHNEKYIVLNGKIYDYDLKEVYDYKADGKEFVALFGHSVLLKETKMFDLDDYYVYTAT